MEFSLSVGALGLEGLAQIYPSFDAALGWLGGALAMLGAWTLFPVVARMRKARNRRARWLWLAGGAFGMGTGFWAMHWMAMLGFHLPVPVSYQPAIGALALLPVTAGAAVAIVTLAHPATSLARLHVSALALAAGFTGMYFVAMYGLQTSALVVFRLLPGMLAPLLGYLFALLALYANRALSARPDNVAAATLGSLLLALAGLAAHYPAIAATRFFVDPQLALAQGLAAPAYLIPVIAISTLLIVGLLWIGSLIDARLGAAVEALRDSEARSRAIIETMPDGHIVVDTLGHICSFNPMAETIFGITAQQACGRHIGMLIANHVPSMQPDRWPKQNALFEGGRRMIFPDGGRRQDGSVFPIEIRISMFKSGNQSFYSCICRDLTGEYAAEQRMRRLAAAVEHAGEAIAILDRNHVICDVNPQYERQTGYSRDEIIGHQPGRATEDLESLQKIWRTVDQGLVWKGVQKSLRRDGSTCYEELTVTPVRDDLGGIAGYVAVMRDISQRMEEEAERRQLAQALEYAADGIAVLDAQGRVLYVNAAYESHIGVDRHALRGTRLDGYLDFSPEPASYQQMRQTVRAGQSWHGLLLRRNADGGICQEETSVAPIRNADGQVTSHVVVTRDVTERRRVEAEHRSLVAAVEQAPIGIEIIDLEGRIRYCNAAIERRIGRPRNEILGRPCYEHWNYDRADGWKEAMIASVLRGERWTGRLRRRDPAGTVFTEDITVAPVRDHDGRINTFVSMKSDVTEQCALESQLARAQKLEAIGRLAAGIAHEINTPVQYVGDNLRFVRDSYSAINALLSRLQALAAATPQLAAALQQCDLVFLREEIPRALDQSADGCQRIAAIVRAMKEFSHPGHDKTPVDLNRAIESAITVASNEWKYVADLITDFDPALPQVTCLPGEFNQVILNMLVNAAHAIADVLGDGAPGKGRISVVTRRSGEFAEVRISDTGTGIAPELREKIFDPFFTTKAIGRGTGQGLAIAHDVIVNKHHGSIAVESQPGRGSTFIIRMPIDPDTTATGVARVA